MHHRFGGWLAIRWAMGLSLLLALPTLGCAYRAGYGGRQLPGGYRTIAVPMFKNKTHDAGIEVYLTNAMVRELERMRVGQLTPKSEAQVTLLGTIEEIKYRPDNTVLINQQDSTTAANGTKLNFQYAINLKVGLKLLRNADQKVLWEGSFVREQNYNTPQILNKNISSANALYNHSARYQNLEIMANDLMLEAHDRMTENF